MVIKCTFVVNVAQYRRLQVVLGIQINKGQRFMSASQCACMGFVFARSAAITKLVYDLVAPTQDPYRSQNQIHIIGLRVGYF